MVELFQMFSSVVFFSTLASSVFGFSIYSPYNGNVYSMQGRQSWVDGLFSYKQLRSIRNQLEMQDIQDSNLQMQIRTVNNTQNFRINRLEVENQQLKSDNQQLKVDVEALKANVASNAITCKSFNDYPELSGLLEVLTFCQY